MARTLTITAVIAAYNEEDVIGAVLADLCEQGIRVYLLDQGSTDGTAAEAERFRGHGLIDIERVDSQDFSLARVIRRKELLAAELQTDWLINADADEFRESPWPDVGFVAGIEQVDRLGYNAVDFAVINFLPVREGFTKGDDPRDFFRFWEPGAAFDRLQIRCWKKQPVPLDLVSTAGHEARFADRRVFPLRFLLRHYPIRGQAHGERKVFRERRPRFAADERARGWHVQYDGILEGQSFVREPSSLTAYDPWAVRLELATRHRGIEALEQERTSDRADLAATTEAWTRTRDELAASRAELAVSRAELGGSREAHAAARELSNVLERELQASRDALQRAEQHGGRLHEELQSTERRVLQLQLETQRLRDESAALRHELAASIDANERRTSALRHRLAELQASRIWRWTGPLRALMDSVSRG